MKVRMEEDFYKDFRQWLLQIHGNDYVEKPTKGEWEIGRFQSRKFGDDPILFYKNKAGEITTFGLGADLFNEYTQE